MSVTYAAACGQGFGIAVCPALGLLATSNWRDSTLSVFRLPTAVKPFTPEEPGASPVDPLPVSPAERAPDGRTIALVCMLGGSGSPSPTASDGSTPAHMHFNFSGSFPSGYLAFTTSTPPLLLVTDAGHGAVHAINVVTQRPAGFVAPPGCIAGPRGVAAHGPLVAVTGWRRASRGDHAVHVFQSGAGSDTHHDDTSPTWTLIHIIGDDFGAPGDGDGQLSCPYGVRFTAEGTGLAVADCDNGRVSLFRVSDGAFVRHVVHGVRDVHDVEEVGGAWVAAGFGSGTVVFLGEADPARVLVKALHCPCALAHIPGLGFFVREFGRRDFLNVRMGGQAT